MLRDADLSLAGWLQACLPPGTGVRFDAPRARWQDEVPDAPFVSVFLCDIRKDDRHQPAAGWSDVRDGDGRLVGRQSPHRYHRLSYLVTAWAGAVVGERGASAAAVSSASVLASASSVPSASAAVFEEHDLLGVLINTCVSAETLAEDYLRGSLAEAGLPVFVRCGEADSAGSAVPDPWPGLGIAPRAHLLLEVVVPVVPPVAKDLAAPVREVVLGAHRPAAPLEAVEAVAAGDAVGAGEAVETVKAVEVVETVRRRDGRREGRGLRP